MRRRNNRPIRTRPPGRKRPVRWIDAFSAPGASTITEAGADPTPNPGVVDAGGIYPFTSFTSVDWRELVVGDLDTEWADANEVVVERLVGDIRVAGRELFSSVDNLVSLAPRWIGMPPLVRMGIVLVEDVDDAASSYDPPSLWQPDDLADGEWLWLWQLGSPNEAHMQLDEGASTALRVWTHDYHLDLWVKRKLGRRDRLVLCHEWAHVGPTFSGDRAIDVQPLLRCLVSTK